MKKNVFGFNGDNLYNEEIPLPTKSTTQNLIKDSEIVSL